jgi:hypothetical protein
MFFQRVRKWFCLLMMRNAEKPRVRKALVLKELRRPYISPNIRPVDPRVGEGFQHCGGGTRVTRRNYTMRIFEVPTALDGSGVPFGIVLQLTV